MSNIEVFCIVAAGGTVGGLLAWFSWSLGVAAGNCRADDKVCPLCREEGGDGCDDVVAVERLQKHRHIVKINGRTFRDMSLMGLLLACEFDPNAACVEIRDGRIVMGNWRDSGHKAQDNAVKNCNCGGLCPGCAISKEKKSAS